MSTMKGACAARMEKWETRAKFVSRKVKEKGYLENISIDETNIS
jgi:hypothetical protein